MLVKGVPSLFIISESAEYLFYQLEHHRLMRDSAFKTITDFK